MNRFLGVSLIAGLLTIAGCFTVTLPEPNAPTIDPAPSVRESPPVTPDQITEQNARQKAMELDQELSREEMKNQVSALPR